MGVARLAPLLIALLALDASAQVRTFVAPQIKLGWNAPTELASGPVIGCELVYRTDLMGAWVRYALYDASVVLASVALPLCEATRFRLQCYSATEWGALSDESERYQRCGNPELDGSGYVGLGDFGVFAGCYGHAEGQPAYRAECDFDADGVVGLSDYGAFGARLGWRLTGIELLPP